MSENKNAVRLSRQQVQLVEAILFMIEQEMSRVYWNIYQREMESPFRNTGTSYKNKVFQVKAYDWSDVGNAEPNFTYGGLQVWWYKHLGRGTEATMYLGPMYPEKNSVTNMFTVGFLADMLDKCIASLREWEHQEDDETIKDKDSLVKNVMDSWKRNQEDSDPLEFDLCFLCVPVSMPKGEILEAYAEIVKNILGKKFVRMENGKIADTLIPQDERLALYQEVYTGDCDNFLCDMIYGTEESIPMGKQPNFSTI